MTTPNPERIAEIAESLSEAQRDAIINAHWLHPGGQDPIAVVKPVPPWPEGIAQFFTISSDRLTPLGLAVRDHLKDAK